MYDYALFQDHVTITKYTGEEPRAEVPDRIEGLPVTAIDDYAFSATGVTHIDLPDTIEKIGRYCLYNCIQLEELSFTDSLRDIGAGAFTGCHHIRRLSLRLTRGETSALRDVLLEVPEELEVTYQAGMDKAELIFPEYFEEGVENTPARIIEHHFHGSGMFYRNCFVSKALQFSQYDQRFPYARGQEEESLLIRLATKRLCYPLGLSPKAKAAYEEYLGGHFDQALDYYEKRREPDKVSFLMDWRHGSSPTKAKRPLSFDL